MHKAKHLFWMAALALGACSEGDPATTDATTPPPTREAGAGSADASSGKNLDAGALLDAASANPARSDAQVVRCTVAPDCLSVRTAVLSLAPCCSEATSCGFAYESSIVVDRATFSASLGLAPGESCVPETTIFHTAPTGESQRVPLGDGGQVLVSTDCPTSFVTSIPFRGCCLPNNECALTTYPAQAELKVLVDGADLPFTRIECVKADELNAQIKASQLAGYGRVLSTTGSCNYAELDRTLPRASP